MPTAHAPEHLRPSGARRSRRRPLARAAALVLAASLLTVGCGSDDDTASTTTEKADKTTTTEVATDTTGAGGTTEADHETIHVTGVDFAFEGLPSTIKAGTKLTLQNAAETELHELVAIKLPDDEERSLDELLKLPPADLEALIGAAPPATVLLAAPGADQIPAVGDGTLTEPGRYVVLCAIPTGVDPAVYLAAAAESQGGPPDVPGGPPHFTQGMVAELTVTP